ncbi:MAG TPA: metallophosphoesterase family protein [Sumerlaeia bacterium]|nr:metallophosphoesterase family protein [Sumerlaeia bacterium]
MTRKERTRKARASEAAPPPEERAARGGEAAHLVVFSDVHGNLPALRTFFDEMDSRAGIDAVVCCGDLVGYGAHPNECCQLVRERRIPCVLGNHDAVALNLTGIGFFNEIARAAALWSHEHLEKTHADYLAGLPYAHLRADLTFVHGSPANPEAWDYILSTDDAADNFDAFDSRICFIGHSHWPVVFEARGDGEARCLRPGNVRLRRDCRYIVNVGSVGQPRDGDPRLCYVTVDREANLLQYHRVPYPVSEAQRAIAEAGLPKGLAYRLAMGV